MGWCNVHFLAYSAPSCPQCQHEKNRFYRGLIDQVAVAKGPGIETVFLPKSAEKVKAWDQKIFDAYMQESAMKTPTQEQLKDPQWWGESAPSDAQYYSHYHGAFAKNVAFHGWLVWKPGGPKPSAPWKEVDFMDEGIFVARPKPQSQEWVDGLPPVGDLVKCLMNDSYWADGRVIGHDEEGGIPTAVCRVLDSYYSFSRKCLRPLKTDAEREREEAVSSAWEILSRNGINYAGLKGGLHALYDAGMLRKGGE